MSTERSKIRKIRLVIGYTEVKTKRKQQLFLDPSQPSNLNTADILAVYAVALATKTDVLKAVQIAKDDPSNWRLTTLTERNELFSRAALNMRK